MTQATLELMADSQRGWDVLWPYVKWLLQRQGIVMPRPVTLGTKFVVWHGDANLLDSARELLGFYRVPLRATLKTL